MSTKRTKRRAGAAVAIVGAGIVPVAASAHSVTSTSPYCVRTHIANPGGPRLCAAADNPADTTSAQDWAQVDASADRTVYFALFAPGTCGVSGATPVYVEDDAVGGSSALHTATIMMHGWAPLTEVGVYVWRVEILHGPTIEWGPSPCSDEHVVAAAPVEPTIIPDAPPTSVFIAAFGAVGGVALVRRRRGRG